MHYSEAYPRFEKWGTSFMASAEREPILGALPPVESRGKSPGRAVRNFSNSDTDFAIKMISKVGEMDLLIA
jgi:hypothetical protein